MTRAITTSRQPSPQPHATGTAATRARKGSAMKMPRATCSPRRLRSGTSVTLTASPAEPPAVVSEASVAMARPFLVLDNLRNRNLRDRKRLGADRSEPYSPSAVYPVRDLGNHVRRGADRVVAGGDPRLVCWQGPPDFESGLATMVRFHPGEPNSPVTGLFIPANPRGARGSGHSRQR